jgi:hypothetical protein
MDKTLKNLEKLDYEKYLPGMILNNLNRFKSITLWTIIA